MHPEGVAWNTRRGDDAETAHRYAGQGLRFIGIGSDATLLAMAGTQTVESVTSSRSA